MMFDVKLYALRRFHAGEKHSYS